MEIKRYKKKPVTITAAKYGGRAEDAIPLITWIHVLGGSAEYRCKDNVCSGTSEGHDVVIRTLEGAMTVAPGDYVIRGVAGEFYPCKPAIFNVTYEEVEDTP